MIECASERRLWWCDAARLLQKGIFIFKHVVNIPLVPFPGTFIRAGLTLAQDVCVCVCVWAIIHTIRLTAHRFKAARLCRTTLIVRLRQSVLLMIVFRRTVKSAISAAEWISVCVRERERVCAVTDYSQFSCWQMKWTVMILRTHTERFH